MIIEGTISDGERINEVKLAQELGISRTPVREGLGQLVSQRFVHIIPRRGFFTLLLSPEEFGHLYDLRPILDVKALTLGGQPTDTQIQHIEDTNHNFQNAKTSLAAVEADEIFHKALISRCPNTVLLELIENLMLRTKRYEYALFKETSAKSIAGEEHKKIIDALRNHDLTSAAKHLHKNLTTGKMQILNWLTARNL